MAADITPPASALFPAATAPPCEPIQILVDHARWWLSRSPVASEFDLYGHEAAYLIEQLSLRLIDAEDGRAAVKEALHAALDLVAHLEAERAARNRQPAQEANHAA